MFSICVKKGCSNETMLAVCNECKKSGLIRKEGEGRFLAE